MKLVIATLKELHEINMGGGREKDTQKKIQNMEMYQMKTNTCMISRQLVSILSCKL